MAIEIRFAEPGDADAIAEVHAASWRSPYRGALFDPYLDGQAAEVRRRHWRQRLVTDPGPGQQLIRAGLAWMRTRGTYDRWHLWVLEVNAPARRVYEHLGGVPVERGVHLAPDGTEFPSWRYLQRLSQEHVQVGAALPVTRVEKGGRP